MISTNPPGGSVESITVNAYGSPDYYVYPHMQIFVNGILMGEWDVTGSSESYTVSAKWNRGEIYAGGSHLATYANGTTYFTHSDWLGDERVRSTLDAGIYSQWMDLPFGEGSNAPNPSPTHFTGKERDPESGLDYFGARYYSSTMGRFLIADNPEADQDRADPQSWNLYAYVRNNPLKNTDPTGNACVSNDGGKTFHNDNSGGESCEQYDEATKNAKANVTVTGKTDPIFVKDDFNPLSDRAPLAFQGFVNLILNGDARRGFPQLVVGLLPSALAEAAALKLTGPVVAPGLEAAADAFLAAQGLDATTAFNVGKGVLNGETTGISIHALNQALVRGVTSSEISEALTHVPKGTGGSVLRFIGKAAEVRVNQVTGKIVTVIRFSAPN